MTTTLALKVTLYDSYHKSCHVLISSCYGDKQPQNTNRHHCFHDIVILRTIWTHRKQWTHKSQSIPMDFFTFSFFKTLVVRRTEQLKEEITWPFSLKKGKQTPEHVWDKRHTHTHTLCRLPFLWGTAPTCSLCSSEGVWGIAVPYWSQQQG